MDRFNRVGFKCYGMSKSPISTHAMISEVRVLSLKEGSIQGLLINQGSSISNTQG